MNRFIYFFPGASTIASGEFAVGAHGLADVIDARGRDWAVWGNGPAGAGVPGIAMTNKTHGDPSARYEPETQTWVECGGDQPGGADRRFWIGWRTDAKPGPDDLARPDMVPGVKVKLADGRFWQVPMAVAWPVGQIPMPEGLRLTHLPETFRPEPGGDVKRSVSAKYQDLYEFASGVYDEVLSAPDDRLKFERDEAELLPWAVRALGVNYFAGQWELGAALDCFDTPSITNVLAGLLNWPAFELFGHMLAGKKNAPPDFYTRFAGFEESYQDMRRVLASSG